MGTRLDLHKELLRFMSNVYFQPPSTIQMVYPCLVYAKSNEDVLYGNNHLYLNTQGYQLTLIEKNPDSLVATEIVNHFQYCSINQHYVVDNLNHTTINLYF